MHACGREINLTAFLMSFVIKFNLLLSLSEVYRATNTWCCDIQSFSNDNPGGMGKRSKTRLCRSLNFKCLVLAKNHFLDFSRGRGGCHTFVRVRIVARTGRGERWPVGDVFSAFCGLWILSGREADKVTNINFSDARRCRNYPLR